MALIKCHECKSQVSTEARSCPICGAKVKKPISPIGWTLIATIIFAIFSISSMDPRPSPVISRTKTVIDDGNQKKRLKTIKAGIAAGVFYKITKGSQLPHLWVTPIWLALDYDLKSNSADVVYQYYNIDSKGKIDMIPIYSSQTGKELGRYDGSGMHLN